MSLKKRVFRCGCNNSAISIPSVSQGNRTCCQNCTGAPCFYSIMSDCDVWMPNGEWLLSKCTLLRKDCITGCTWSSRWNAGNGSATIDYPAVSGGCVIDRCRPQLEIDCDDSSCPYECFDLTITSASGIPAIGFQDCSAGCYGLGCADADCNCSGTATQPPPWTVRLTRGGDCQYRGSHSCVNALCFGSTAEICRNDGSFANVWLSFYATKTVLRIETYSGVPPGPLGYTNVVEVEFNDITCYSGSIGTAAPPTIGGGGYSFDVSNDDWTIKTGSQSATMTGTITPGAGCGLSGTASGYSDTAQSNGGNVIVTLPATPCWWQEEDTQGGACSLAESFIGPCSDNPPVLDRGWTGTAGTAGIENWRKWILTMNDSGTADSSSLLLRTREGYTATYTATALSCKDPTTFSLASYDSKLRFLPPKLCVIPIESQPPKVCNTGTAQCNCCDDGDLLYVSVVVSGCDGINGTYSGELPRVYDSGSASLPCGVSYPASAPCGVFTLQLGTTGVDDCTVSTIDWSEAVYLVFYCDGTGYSIDVYCWNNDANCWVYQGQGTVTYYECRCYGPLFYFTLPALDCCCQSCEDCTPPSTLYADLSSSCFGWTGTVTLTETAGVWQGSTGAPIQVVDVQLRCLDGNWILNINAVNASCGIDTTVADSWECEPAFSASFTVALSSDCCGPSGGTLSVSVYE